MTYNVIQTFRLLSIALWNSEESTNTTWIQPSGHHVCWEKQHRYMYSTIMFILADTLSLTIHWNCSSKLVLWSMENQNIRISCCFVQSFLETSPALWISLFPVELWAYKSLSGTMDYVMKLQSSLSAISWRVLRMHKESPSSCTFACFRNGDGKKLWNRAWNYCNPSIHSFIHPLIHLFVHPFNRVFPIDIPFDPQTS